ncbi:MAG: HypC/HybG/HupF family hydrogenase formation chaperone [Spirochaetales bacterium]|nr:HypC/HybG/HupF family hydrogenase formation chaperone [Spirochaetales bacterium]
MCLAVPLEVLQLLDGDRAVVRQGEGTLEVDTSLLEAPKIGDYVLVHAGFAIQTIDSEKAEETLTLLAQLEGPASGTE